ncbi:alpha/beta fold hydrolase [Nocardia sp. NPDC057668]|uniref:alpha/beta fold hydrolase n=1 Tax=Nocardia sp. NPDC057668 TaxID=3346202 RepID=UPI00366A6F10
MDTPPAMRRASHGKLSLAYEVIGPDHGRPLLLLMGVGAQMLTWHDDFCWALARSGFQVVRMDNRDAGLSTHLSDLGEPKVVDMILRPKRAARYSLTDMAADAFAVCDAMGWDNVNVVGGSMGGMIAQTMAIERPRRVRSLTSIMSSPSARIGRASVRTSVKVAGLLQQQVHSPEEAGRQLVEMYKMIGTSPSVYPLDADWLHEVGARSYARAYDPAGKLRQQAAMLSAPNRTAALRKLRVPTLVMHGSADVMIRPSGGRATADAVPDSRLVMLPDVGHGAFPREVWPTMIEEITAISV